MDKNGRTRQHTHTLSYVCSVGIGGQSSEVDGEAIDTVLEEEECKEGHGTEHGPPHPRVDGDAKHGGLYTQREQEASSHPTQLDYVLTVGRLSGRLQV